MLKVIIGLMGVIGVGEGPSYGKVFGANNISHQGDIVAGIDTSLGEDAGIASCGIDNVYIETALLADGVGHIRIYFSNLELDSRRASSGRSACVIRLKQSQDSGSKLAVLGARVSGQKFLSTSDRATVALSVQSMGELKLSTRRSLSPSSDENYSFSSSPDQDSEQCASSDDSGFFGINLALSQVAQDGRIGYANVEVLDLYVRQEPCR